MKASSLLKNESENNRLYVLDGLRFFAALTVMMAHYTHWILQGQVRNLYLLRIISELSAIGMPLFFVLSGFVIHYNYRAMHKKQGIKQFLIARFSRIYPLFITLFIFEFVLFFLDPGLARVRAGNRLGMLFALPYHLTLTQDWVFGIIGSNSIIYNYALLGGVSWSLSLEVFFYVFYIFIYKWINNKKNIWNQIQLMLLLYLVLIIYLNLCNFFSKEIDNIALINFGKYATTSHGYQDSLLRWLYYFNPLVNLPSFLFGVISANIYFIVKDKKPFIMKLGWQNILTTLSIVALLFAYYVSYIILAPQNSFIGRTASILYVPIIVLVIYMLVQCRDSYLSRLLSHQLFVKLGESCLSIYLLHAFFGRYPRFLYHYHFKPYFLYLFSICAILAISRFSYVAFEKPMQKWVRKKLHDQQTETVLPRINPVGITD